MVAGVLPAGDMLVDLCLRQPLDRFRTQQEMVNAQSGVAGVCVSEVTRPSYPRRFEGETRLQALDVWVRYPDYLADELLAQYDMFKLVKMILDTRRTNVLLVGEERTGEFVERTPPLKNRDYSALPFRPLTSSAKDIKDFGRLLGSIDKCLPFAEASGLKDLAEDMHRFSGGMIGIGMNVVQAAAAEALNRKRSRVLIEDFRFAVKTRVRPGDDYNYFGYKPRRIAMFSEPRDHFRGGGSGRFQAKAPSPTFTDWYETKRIATLGAMPTLWGFRARRSALGTC